MIKAKYSSFLLVALCLVLIQNNLFSQGFSVKKTPDWIEVVKENDQVGVDEYLISTGVYYSLYDVQIDLDSQSDFYHFVQSITSYSGVAAASQIMISFDPAYQEVEFHSLWVWRKGKKYDRTKDIEFEMLNNEGQLVSSIYHGMITAHTILSDIRKGDRVEMSYTVIGDNPIFGKKSHRFIPLEDLNQIDKLNFKLMFSEEVPYQYNFHGCEESSFKVEKSKGKSVLRYNKSNIESANYEESIPPWVVPYKHFTITGFDGWADVSQWAENVFKVKKNQNLKKVYKELLVNGKSKEEQIDTLIKYVQNEVRYMANHSGIGSHKPRPPSEVLEEMHGDCKDKSLLLSELLKGIGVAECYPALVNTVIGKSIKDYNPSGQLFDHCIVHFRLNGKNYWIDPTLTNQGGSFKNSINPYYNQALVIGDSGEGLTKIDYNDNVSKTEIREFIDLSSFEGSGEYKVRTQTFGNNATYFRIALDYYSLREIADSYKDYLSNIFPNIEETERLKVVDNIDSNSITIEENYEILNYWNIENGQFYKTRSFTYNPVYLYEYIMPLSCESKEYPVFISHPADFEQITTIQLPDDLKIQSDKIVHKNAAFDYSFTTKKLDGNVLELHYKFRSKTDVISPEEFVDYCDDMNSIIDRISYVLTYPIIENNNLFLDFIKKN